MGHLGSHPMLGGLGDPSMSLNAAQLMMAGGLTGAPNASLLGVPTSHTGMEGLVGMNGNPLMLGAGSTMGGPLLQNTNGIIPNTEESKRDMTLTNGGEGENDINIDLGKELQGDMDDGTSKFQEEEGAVD